MLPLICFIHITKSGGVTFHQILHDNLPRFFYINYNKKTDGNFDKHHLRKFLRSTAAQGVGGHTVKPYLDYESIVKRPIFYITFLREPVKRYVSLANYRMYRGWSPDIEHTFEFPRFWNEQIKHLTGQQDIDIAKKILQRIHFVGILEEFDMSLLLLRQQLKPYFDFKINYEKANVAKDRNTDFYHVDTLEKRYLDRIKKENAVDTEFYKMGVAQFEQMQANYEGDLQADLAAFREENKHYHRKKTNYYIQKAKNGLVKKIIQPIIVS